MIEWRPLTAARPQREHLISITPICIRPGRGVQSRAVSGSCPLPPAFLRLLFFYLSFPLSAVINHSFWEALTVACPARWIKKILLLSSFLSLFQSMEQNLEKFHAVSKSNLKEKKRSAAGAFSLHPRHFQFQKGPFCSFYSVSLIMNRLKLPEVRMNSSNWHQYRLCTLEIKAKVGIFYRKIYNFFLGQMRASHLQYPSNVGILNFMFVYYILYILYNN